MSYPTMAAVMELQAELSANEFGVLMALAHRQNQTTGRCCPSYEQLAKDTGLSRATVARVLQKLKTKDLLLSITVGNGTKFKHNEYVLMVTKSQECGTDQVSNAPRPSLKSSIDQVSNRTKSKSHSCETGTRKLNKEEEQGKTEQISNQSFIHSPKSQILKNNPEVLPMAVNEANKTIELWNKQEWAKPFKVPKSYTNGRYPENSTFAKLVALSSECDWTEQFQNILEAYSKSEYLRNGGKGRLNTLAYLIENPTFVEAVLSGKYEDRKPSKSEPSGAKLTDAEELKKQGFSVFDGNA